MSGFRFYVKVYENGEHQLSSFSTTNQSPKLESLLFHVVNYSDSVKRLKLAIEESYLTREKIPIGFNNLQLYISGELTEIGFDDEPFLFDCVSTKVLLEYLDQAIQFRDLYEKGGIPGLIPNSNMEV